jgi:hypothetical protein
MGRNSDFSQYLPYVVDYYLSESATAKNPKKSHNKNNFLRVILIRIKNQKEWQ